MWQFPQQFFNIDVKRLDNIARYVGADNVKNIDLLQLHMKSNLGEFRHDVKVGVEAMMKSMKKITKVIDKSIYSQLTRAEMEDILLAYSTKARAFLPDYIIEQVMAAVEDETVWGFSQAISHVRTHGQFKFTDSTNAMFKGVEDRDLTWRLENIAGEVLSLTPTINDIHKTHGAITLEFLVGEDKAKEVRATEQAKAEKKLAKVAEVAVKA